MIVFAKNIKLYLPEVFISVAVFCRFSKNFIMNFRYSFYELF